MATYTVFGSMPGCDPEPQEIKELGTKETAVLFMRDIERTAHPDIHFWAENNDNGKRYFSFTCIDTPCTCYDCTRYDADYDYQDIPF